MIYRTLGKTGFQASAFGLGGESALYERSDEAVGIILRALELGVNYLDTAPLYAESELNYGEALSSAPDVRQSVFLATKTDRRRYDDAWRQFEASLKRLQTSYVDLLQIHHLDFQEELTAILARDGAVRMAMEAKEQGLARFVGVTGHSDPEVLLRAIEARPFDAILLALNPADVHRLSFRERLLPRARELGMGVMAMKVFARGRLFGVPGIDGRAAVHYVLSLPVDVAVIGVMNREQLERDAALASGFRAPLSAAEMARLERAAAPDEAAINFYRMGAGTPTPGFGDMPTEAL